MAITEFIIEGMTCEHCVKTATKALESVEGVHQAKVELQSKTAQVEYDETVTNEEQFFSAIKEKDYTPVKKN